MSPLPPEENPLHASLDTTLREWVERYQREVVFENVRYRGVLTWKNVLDLWVYQEIIWEAGIEAVVEIGVRHGGTTLWLSDTLRNFVGDRGRVIAIDLEPPALELPDNVTFLEGDSVAAQIVERVSQLCSGRRTLVLADGNHARARSAGVATLHAARFRRFVLHRRRWNRGRDGVDRTYARPSRGRAAIRGGIG